MKPGRRGPGTSTRDHAKDALIPVDIRGLKDAPRLFPAHNILFVGTMNDDESTQSLSEKVLDRGNVPAVPRTGATSGPGAGSGTHGRPEAQWFAEWRGWVHTPRCARRRRRQTRPRRPSGILARLMQRLRPPFRSSAEPGHTRLRRELPAPGERRAQTPRAARRPDRAAHLAAAAGRADRQASPRCRSTSSTALIRNPPWRRRNSPSGSSRTVEEQERRIRSLRLARPVARSLTVSIELWLRPWASIRAARRLAVVPSAVTVPAGPRRARAPVLRRAPRLARVDGHEQNGRAGRALSVRAAWAGHGPRDPGATLAASPFSGAAHPRAHDRSPGGICRAPLARRARALPRPGPPQPRTKSAARR